jgi:hypothetical protein
MNSYRNVSLVRTIQAAVVRSGIQRVFVSRLRRAKGHVRHVVVVSPWITSGAGNESVLNSLLQIIRSQRLVSYFITRRPQNSAHLEAVEKVKSCPTAELVYNDNVHAKIYAAPGPPPYGFALLGSANLTAGSLELYEIGLLIVGVGAGTAIVDDLANFGFRHLRTRPESEVVKKMQTRSLQNAI